MLMPIIKKEENDIAKCVERNVLGGKCLASCQEANCRQCNLADTRHKDEEEEDKDNALRPC